MVNARRSSPRRAKKVLSRTETYWLAGPGGKAVEFQATVSVYGCGPWGSVAGRPLLGLLEHIQETLVERGFSQGERDTFINWDSGTLEGLEARAKRDYGDYPEHADDNVPQGQGEKRSNQESIPIPGAVGNSLPGATGHQLSGKARIRKHRRVRV